MTDRAQFEAMLEALINEDHESAKEIFHNIVVGKSREIYAELLESDFEEDGEEEAPAMEEEAEEDGAEEEEGDEEGSEDDSEEDPFGGDDEEGDDEFGGEEGEGDMEDRVMDLEDALEDLKAEFEQLMAGEEAEEHDHPGIHDMGGDDMGGEMDMGMDEDDAMPMMEYVNKVGGSTYNTYGKMGDNGVNTKSIVAGKNDMGGTTANIARTDVEHSVEANKGQLKGNGVFKGSKPQLQDGGNVNVPGANAGKTGFKKKEPGHGAEKAGAKETPDNKTSMLNGAPKRAK